MEEELNSKYQDVLNRYQQNPSNVSKQEAEKLKSELEALYDQKVEGIIVRSRARWHEHGEKNSKYFLNLEKGNHIKKHIRKLYISGTISTDPFQIIDPLSSYLFIIAAEILAIAIQTNTDIQGHKIGKEELKLVQYVDDLTVFVPNVASAQLVFHFLDQFRFCSGLK